MAAQALIRIGLGALALGLVPSVASSQGGPSRQTQQNALTSVVYVEAKNCPDAQDRGGTGFVFERPGQIITALHVVGGCSTVSVVYPENTAAAQRRFSATIARVYASGDLAMLQAANPPATRSLKMAPPPPDKTVAYVGLGFQNAELSADGIEVTFSPSPETRLRGFLPSEAQQELSRSGSRIDTNREVLRFNKQLEPGMSGGPIINQAGDVVGVVAGGLKAGTVPASWGWPAEWVANLLASQEPSNTPVSIAGTFYTLHELAEVSTATRTGRTITCGGLTFSYRGRRSYQDVSRGNDDPQRLAIITQFSRRDDLDQLRFDVWVHEASGATALMPAGYAISSERGACAARSRTSPLHQVLWGAFAQPFEVQSAALAFERNIMASYVPYQFGFRWDLVLTKFALNNFGQPILAAGPLPQTRNDGLVFTRKGFIHPKTPNAPQGPVANSFEMLAARNGAFMGAGTINDDVPLLLGQCKAINWSAPSCAPIYAQFKEWTLFVLCTQLSTYPVI